MRREIEIKTIAREQREEEWQRQLRRICGTRQPVQDDNGEGRGDGSNGGRWEGDDDGTRGEGGQWQGGVKTECGGDD